MDEADQAQGLTDRWLAEQLRCARPAEPAVWRIGARNCLTCNEPIPAERLRVMPWAERCVDCQAELERMLARYR